MPTLAKLRDMFVDAMAVAGVPKVHVAILDPSTVPYGLEIVIDAGIITQSLVVTELHD